MPPEGVGARVAAGVGGRVRRGPHERAGPARRPDDLRPARQARRAVPAAAAGPGVAVGAALSTVGGQATLCFNCADGTHDAYALVGAAVAHWERLRAAAGE